MSKIPLEIQPVFEELKTEITWLHGRWIIYRQLFAKSERRVDFLNEIAGAFFYVVQDALLNDVMIALSKLTDPAKTFGKNDNLSIEQLHELVAKFGDQALAGRLRQTLNELVDSCKGYRTHRNKRLAHFDLQTSLKSKPLPGISREMIERSLEFVRDYMNQIDSHYNDSETAYEHFILRSDGEHLIAALKHGARYEELLKSQAIAWTDFRDSSWGDI